MEKIFLTLMFMIASVVVRAQYAEYNYVFRSV